MTFDPEWLPEFDDHWHLVGYAYDDEGGVIKGDRDGNWEPADSYPEPEVFLRAWAEYSEWVAEHGEDPLDEFTARGAHPYKVTRVYEFRVRSSILGPLVTEWRKGSRGKWSSPKGIPEALGSYLGLEPKGGRYRLKDFTRFADLIKTGAEAGDVTWRGVTELAATGRIKLKETIARSPKVVSATLRREARKALARDRKDFPGVE